jgi:hypothetical protein
MLDQKEIESIRKQIETMVGKQGAYVLMLHDGTAIQAWVDGETRVKQRGLLELGNEFLKTKLTIEWSDPRTPAKT